MKKILIISYADDVNGAEGSLRLTTRYWANTLGWKIDVFHPQGNNFKDCSLIYESGMNPISNIMSGMQYDFVLVNLFHNYEWINNINNVPIVFWIHEGNSALDNSELTISKLSQIFQKASSVIFSTKYQSDVLFKSFLRNVCSKSIHVVPYAVESLDFKIPKKPKFDDKFKISWVGSVIGRKRPLDLVYAVQNLSNQISVKVDFIGPLFNSWSVGQAFESIKISNSQLFTWHDTLPHEKTLELVSDSDIFCFTSEDESTGLAPLEAASLNVPVIIARLPVYEYVGWKDNVNCLMYSIGNIKELEHCILRMYEEPELRARLVFQGAKLVKQFSPTKFLNSITLAVSEL